MSHDSILLDLDTVKERLVLFTETFPEESVPELFKLDTKNKTTTQILADLATKILYGKSTAAYIFIYKPIFLEILSYWTTYMKKDEAVKVLEVSSKLITLYPLSMSLIEEFLERENDHFIAVLQNPSSQGNEKLFHVLFSYYRLLFHDRDIFIKFIKPDLLYTILSNIGQTSEEEIIKLLAIKILAIYLNMGERALDDMTKTYITSDELLIGSYNGDSNIDYKFLELNEAKRFSNFSKLPEVEESIVKLPEHDYFTMEPTDLTEKVVSICGILVPKITNNHIKEEKAESSFIPTEKTIAALRNLAKQIQSSSPMMLIGKAGAGKTFIINELSKYMGCQNSIVKIHLGEQTDAKLLIGTYTSGEKPGTFEWRSGVLTTAVKEGRWVLIEDIDKAPTEVLSILLSLLERRELTIPSRGETIKAANGFQLISTVRVNDEDIKRSGNSNDYNLNLIGMRIWNIIHMEEISEIDLHNILCQRYPVLSQLIPKLILTYESVKNIYQNPRFVSLNRGAHARVVSVRDLVKLCQRLEILFISNNITKPDQLIESTIYDSIFSEAADCFSGSIGEFKALEPLIHAIGESLEIASSRVSLFLNKHVPQFEDLDDHIIIGRTELEKSKSSVLRKSANSTSFAMTNHSLKLMEQIAVAVKMTEAVLLVGETGTGKTTVVQQLAKRLNRKLTVINVSQQTETGDLLGGYKPVNSKTIAVPVQETFESLFASTFSLKKNERFYKMLHKCFNKNQWKNVVRLWNEAFKMAQSILKEEDIEEGEDQQAKKKKRRLSSHDKKILLEQWFTFKDSVEKFEAQSSSLDNSFVFDFIEGSLVKAVRNGEWLLLDEINLASADTLESISDLLTDAATRSILLSEKGDVEPVLAHPNFKIFSCMNPATDVGKRDLPSGIRSRFTEIYVHSPDRDITDLLSIIDKYIGKYSVSDEWVGNDIAELYLEAKKLSDNNQIVDGSNQKPHFSVRTLTRTLLYVCDIIHIYGLRRSLYDGFCMSFLTLLDQKSSKLLEPIIEKYTLGRVKNVKSLLSRAPPAPGPDYIQFNHYWMQKGLEEIKEQAHYIITPFVEKNMMNLVRATSSRRFPVLVQGPTSAGKTSMIKYLADITGHKFVRINNHEHTDLQEYLGTYIADDTGKLCFKEGVLVEALRKGHWIVLDELNLAPTDVLEALNRLLDDNRELFIPETQEVVHPHPNFMLFATQNPPGIYGGRKVLSRAFRNRFLELHFDDIPQDELEIILRERCQIAPTYAKKIVEVYRQLSIERSASRLFEQKNSFATLRDLFRWALREAVGYEELAANGYMLLAERCRNPQEKIVIKKILEKVMKVKLNMQDYYSTLEDKNLETQSSVVWTGAFRRLSVLVSSCLKNNEPILLVGETGCGKTTICQLLAKYLEKELITLNAHQNTETGDILGAQRPVRNRSELQGKLIAILQIVLQLNEETDLDLLLKLYKTLDKSNVNEEQQYAIKKLQDNLGILFEWSDGPLIHALKSGNFFLLDEISLADDSVLERLNSVLEPERSILLAEKGATDNFVTAEDGFQFFATMNPGGDYGKKELSPALRNRFTEIWVPSMENFEDVRLIVSSRLSVEVKDLTNSITEFSEWFGKKFGNGNATNGIISLRDILAWVEFINSTYTEGKDKNAILVHGASMVFIDALGTNNTAYLAENEEMLRSLKTDCVKQLGKYAKHNLVSYLNHDFDIELSNDTLSIGLFDIKRCDSNGSSPSFNLNAPTTASNLMRVMRALQVHKPILLEGSPGVGKTSLITALADITGNNLTRINLSEQTDLVDLFGSDTPGERSGEFVWRDAPFLRAMQQGDWVLLDEMNLASQSVLEGLNACLDHRGEAYIPELDRSFTCHPNFVVFAAQNPQYQGGGRKGLPKSFVNRFTVVYVDILKTEDLVMIANHLYPNIEEETSLGMIKVMSTLEHEICKQKKWATAGSPWEFNLRDALRWLKLLNKLSISNEVEIFNFVDTIVKQRFRTAADKEKAQLLIEEVFGEFTKKENFYRITTEYIQMNSEVSNRNALYSNPTGQNLVPLQCNIPVYETVLRCINNNWPLILVGPTNSGKTDIVQYMASVIGAELDIFSMNSDVDSMDILGGYEQVDITRKISYVINDLKLVLTELLCLNLGLGDKNFAATICAMDLLRFISNDVVTIKTFSTFEAKFMRLFSYLLEEKELIKLKDRVDILSEITKQDTVVKFEWFDGMLVRAVEQGHWLVLDNANLCSPSVLDRLNSLLETDGSLLINECSQENGEPRVLKPHPNFRLFLTMNPKYGELSRAMRNRGIEVYVNDLNERATTFDSNLLSYQDNFKKENETTELEDNFKELNLKNINLTIPVTRFVPTNKSQLLTYAFICDILERTESTLAIEAVASVIPMTELTNLKKWQANVTNNHSFTKKELILSLCDYINFLGSKDMLEMLNQMECASETNIYTILGKEQPNVSSQLLQPLLNIYSLPMLKKSLTNIDSPEAVYFFSCFRLLLSITQKLQRANTRSQNAKIDDLNYIERSAAVANGRHIKNAPRIPIFSLLLGISQHVSEKLVNEPIFESSDLYQLYWQLLVLLESSFDTTTQKDEARLRVYKESLFQWSQSAEEKGYDISEFLAISRKFEDTLNLTRGHSITTLWESFRKSYPSTKMGWKFWDELFDLCKNFDEVKKLQFEESYKSINDLTEVFLILFQDILHNDISNFDELVDKLKTGIEELENISSKFLNKRRHFFKDDFDNLLRFLVNNDDSTLNLIKEISAQSSVDTTKLIKYYSGNYTYPPVFDLMWTPKDGIYSSSTDAIITSKYLESLVRKSNQFTSFTGSQIAQTLSDARTLLRTTIKASHYILDNPLDKYSNVLFQWIKDVINAHTKSDINELKIEDYQTVIEQETEKTFINVFETYLLPSMNICKNSFSDLGRAWILFGAGLIVLFAPDSPYDPAISDYVNYDIFMKHKTFSEELVNSWSTIREVISGDEKIEPEKFIEIIDDNDAPEKPKVYRPQETIDNLFDEWTAFLNSTVSSEQSSNLVGVMEDWNKIADDRHDMFQQNTSNFLKRLENGFKYFSDLNEIFTGYVMSMKFGFDLLKYSQIENTKKNSLSTLWSVDPLVISNSSKINDSFLAVNNLIRKSTIDETNSENVLTFFLRLFKMHNMKKDMIPLFNKVLHSLYYRWSLRRMREEQKQQEESSIFKYTDTDDDIEAEFSRMFPDYEDSLSMDDGVMNQTETGGDMTQIYYEISSLYMAIFEEDNQENISEIVEEGSALVDTMIQESRKLHCHSLTGNQLASVLTNLSEKIQMFDKDTDSRKLNFYINSSISEMQRAVKLVSNLWTTVHSLLEQWPEHATLREISRICQEFLNFPADTPLAKSLQKIEQVYVFIVEWEKYASSKVSLNLHITNFTNLIVSWRRLELHTWNGLFNAEDEKVKKGLGKWWFYLFESIIVSGINQDSKLPEDDIINTELVISLNTFFSKSTFGEFGERLKLVESFKKHVEILDLPSSGLLNALNNVLTFYKQFQPTILEQLTKGRKSLEKDVSEVILLASWKDVNIDALKQSSRRSHNSLFRLVRKYRALLSTNVLPSIENGLPYIPSLKLELTNLGIGSFAEFDIESSKKLVVGIPEWDTRSAILKNVDVVGENMRRYIDKVSDQTFPNFVTFVKDYARESDRLRDETPGVYKKEIEKLLATLKVQKRKLFSDALKELRRSGLRTNLREDIHKVQNSATAILANTTSWNNTILEGSDFNYFRVIDLLPRLRNSISSPADDVPIAALEKSMAIIENLVFSLITTKEPILKLTQNFENLKKLRFEMENVCSSKGSIKHFSLEFSITRIKIFCKWLPVLLDYALKVLQVIEKSTSTNDDLTFISQSKITLSNFNEKIENLGVLDSTASQLISEFKNFIANFIRKANEGKTELNFFVFDMLLSWIEENSSSDVKTEVVDEIKLQDVDNSLRKVYKSIMLAFQKVMENDIESVDMDEDKWLATTSKKTMANIKSLHGHAIVKNLKSSIELLQSSDISISTSSLVRAMVVFTMPIINQYYILMRTILEKTRSYYVNTSHGTYILSNILLNLSKNGFCSPQAPSEEVEDNNLHDGTGLGDGEGAQNNSNDIEQDDELTEDAQQENKDQKDKDEREDEEDDDAVDMEGEMAGQMEELSDQDEKDDENEDIDDEEELDEEIDDLDEDDPNAIDDKMWDEKPEEDNKEKNSDKDLDTKGDDEDVQANEEDDQDTENNDDKTKEQENSKEESKPEEETNEENNDKEENDDENKDEGEDGDEEDDVGEQEDDVRDEEGQELDQNVPEVETMDLPDDMNLDSGEEEEEGSGSDNDGAESFEDEDDEEEDVNMEEDKSNLEDQMEIDDDAEEQDDEAETLPEDVQEQDTVDGEEDDDENENNPENEGEEPTGENESDQEELGSDQAPNDEEQEKGADNDVEGLDGIDNGLEEETIDADAAVQEQSGARGSGSDAKDSEEQENIGGFGATQNEHQDQEDDQTETTDASREEAKETMKQLGDSLKEFHRRRQEINEASQRDEEEDESKPKANERPDEFEHVEGANTETDTQALGAASEEQLQSINDEMAIDDDISNEEEDKENDMKEEDQDGNILGDEDVDMDQEKPEDKEGEDNQNDDTKGKGMLAGENEDEDELENDDEFNEDDLLQGKEYEDELDELMDTIDQETLLENENDIPKRNIEESRELWHKSEVATADLVSRLGEQLRLILEPTLATKLKGDYKTGKRLNMKRVIPYIASQFRKDKIWLRRTKPSKRQYQIMIALDNSKSMSESNCVKLAFDSLCLVSRTLTQLESGGLSIVKFGEHSKEVHSFDQQFSTDAGSKVFQWFDFQDTKTDVKKLVAESLKIFERGRSITNSDQWQLQIIISDGVCEDHETIQRLVRRAREKKIMLVFVIIDGITSNESIMDMSQVNYVPDAHGNLQLNITKYLDSFPFEFYVVVHDISELPEMLSLILRQYFSDLASS